MDVEAGWAFGNQGRPSPSGATAAPGRCEADRSILVARSLLRNRQGRWELLLSQAYRRGRGGHGGFPSSFTDGLDGGAELAEQR